MAIVNKLEKQTGGVVNTLDKKLGKLKKRSDSALQTFRDTLEELDDVNKEIDTAVQVAENHINSLNEKKATLLAHKASNEKVGNKIREFLGLE